MEGFQREKIIRYCLITILDSYMTETELEQVIREYILDIYKKKYVGKIKIQKLNPGYSIHLGMSTPEKPLVICGQLEDSDFLKFLKEELRTKKFHLVYYGELNEKYPYDC